MHSAYNRLNKVGMKMLTLFRPIEFTIKLLVRMVYCIYMYLGVTGYNFKKYSISFSKD